MIKPYTYTKSSTVQHVFRHTDEDGNIRFRSEDKVNISNDAKQLLGLYSDCSVKNGIKNVINTIPRKIKGKNSGDLRKVTIGTNIVGSGPSKCMYARIKMAPIKRDLFSDRGKKLRLSKDAKCPLARKLEVYLMRDLGDLKSRMPKITRGPNIGNLKRKTLIRQDFEEFNFDTCKWEF